MTHASAGGGIPPADSTVDSAAAPLPPPAPRKRWRPFGQPVSAYDQKSAMLFLAPMMLVLSVVAVFPVVYSFWISLFDLKLTRPHRVPFVWFDNYLKIFQDSLFWESVGRLSLIHISEPTR